MTFLSPSWRSLSPLKGHLTIPKRSQRITRYMQIHSDVPSLKLTAFSPLQMDGWKTILSYWGPAYFQGRAVSFRECMLHACMYSAAELLHGFFFCFYILLLHLDLRCFLLLHFAPHFGVSNGTSCCAQQYVINLYKCIDLNS